MAEIIAHEISGGKFHKCHNPDCDMYITGNVLYCCLSCEMGHALGKSIAHDKVCSDRKTAQIKAWGTNTPPLTQFDLDWGK